MTLHVVTGGSGFCGGHIAQTLLDRGEEVRIVDVIPPEIDDEDLAYVEADVRDTEAVADGLAGADRVYHSVALVPVTKAGDTFYEVNVDGTRNVVQAANGEDVDHLVHLGSSSVYALDRMPITEETPLEAKGPYSRSKAQADAVVREQAQVPASVIRPRTVVGPRRAGLFSILFDWVSEGRRVYTVGPGDNLFQMVSPRDLTEASLLAADRPDGGVEVYNVGTDDYGTMREAIQAVVDHAGTGSRVSALPRRTAKAGMWLLDKLGLSPLTTFHYKTIDRDFYFDVSKAKEDLGWEPRDGNRDCMAGAYDWYSEHGGERGEADGAGHRHAPDEGVLRILRRLS